MHFLPWKRVSSAFGAALTLFSGSLLLFVGCSQQATPPPPATKTIDVRNRSNGSNELLYPARKDGLFGYVNSSGKFVIHPQFTSALPFHGDRAAVKLGGEPTSFGNSNGYLDAADDGARLGFIDRTGRFAISPRFHCVNQFGTGQYAAVAKEISENKLPKECTSILNAKGSSVEKIECEQLAQHPKVCSGWTLIDRSGKEMLQKNYESLEYDEGDLVAATAQDSQGRVHFGYIDLSGNWVVAPEYDYATPIHNGWGTAQKNGTYSIIDSLGRTVSSGEIWNSVIFSGNFSEGLSSAARRSSEGDRPRQYGYIDHTGTFLIQPQFDDALGFSEGLAPVKIAGLWGFANHDGQLAINPSFKWVSSFRNGRAAVCSNEGKLTFIDDTGQLLGGTSFRPCPKHVVREEKFNAAYHDGTFSYDYDVDNTSGEQSTGWTIVDSSGRVIYQERSAAVASVGKSPNHPDDDIRVITGTAFAVSDSGYLLTNAHVVQGCSKVELTSAKTSAEVMQSDRSNDLALLHAILPGNRYARIGRAEDFTLGTEVIIFGFPLNGVVASSGNLTTGVVSAVTGIGDDSRYFQLTAPIQPGNSGGPVMNEYGEVIGVASAMLDQQKAFAATGTIPQNVNFAIGPSMIRQFLSANGIPAASLTTWWRFKQGTQKLAQSAEAFTYSVKCEPKGTREERKIE